MYLTALDRGGEKQRVADTSIEAAYVPPPQGAGAGYLLMIKGDSLVAQPFDATSLRIAGPAVAIPGAGNALTFSGANRSNLSVANDGTVVYAAGSNQYQLVWFSPDGTAVRNVGVPDRYVGLRISPDETQALTMVDDAVGNRDAWRMDLTRGARTRLTLDNQGGYAVWSPDGQRIAFTGLTRQTLLEKTASGDSGEQGLVRSDFPMYPSDWSRDGKRLLYAQDTSEHQYDLWALSFDGASKATPILQSPAGELHGEFSPDGKFIAFTSDESGRNEVYIQNVLDPTTRRRVSTGGGGYPRWSRKGSELFYRSLGSQLLAVPVRFNGTSVDLGDARFVMLLLEPPGLHPYPYDVASDGRILALAPVSGEATDPSLTVLVNWQAALGR